MAERTKLQKEVQDAEAKLAGPGLSFCSDCLVLLCSLLQAQRTKLQKELRNADAKLAGADGRPGLDDEMTAAVRMLHCGLIHL